MNTPFQVKVDADHRRCIVGGKPMVFHCHHYNVTLQRTLIDAADYADFRPLLVGAAAAVAHAQLGPVFRESGVASFAERARMASELYRWAGFGTFDLGALGADGGRVTTVNSHYAHGWKSRFGRSEAPVCFFASGFLAGRWSSRTRRPIVWYGVLEIGVGVLAVLTPLALDVGGDVYVWFARNVTDSLAALTFARFVVSFAVLIVPATLMGASLPLVVSSSMLRSGRLGGRVGLLYASNTAGGIGSAGPLPDAPPGLPI